MFDTTGKDECMDINAEEVGYIIYGDVFEAHDVDNSLPECTNDNDEVHSTCVTEAQDIAKSLTAFVAGQDEHKPETVTARIFLKQDLGDNHYIAEVLVSTVIYNKNTKRWSKK